MNSPTLANTSADSPIFDEEHVMLRDTLRRFVDEEVKP